MFTGLKNIVHQKMLEAYAHITILKLNQIMLFLKRFNPWLGNLER